MFTGLVEEVAVVRSIQRGPHGAHLRLGADKVVEGVRLGDSIAVNGACLTVVGFGGHWFSLDAVPETMRRTALGRLSVGERVNVERALRVGDRLGGHLVSGHVDGVGVIRDKSVEGMATVVTIAAADEVLRYIVEKGSICVDGVSLTVMETQSDAFRVSVIPHTGEHTTLLYAKPGQQVNLECDIIAKYVERFVLGRGTPAPVPERGNLEIDYLRQHGFA